MGSDKMNIAIIGYGTMGGWHVRQIQHMDSLKLCGIYDINPERMDSAASQGINTYKSLDELLQDKQVECVTVAIPNDQHHDVCIDAMKAGKNVVCEKPVCLNSQELKEMVEISKQQGVLFSVHQNRRWDHDFLIAKKLFDENTMGRVYNIESRVHGSRGIPGDWRKKKACGGGMVLDWGVHLLDQAMLLAGERKLKSVYAQLDNVSNGECEDGFKILLTFSDGLHFHVEVETNNYINLPRWFINGEKGTAVIEDFKCNGYISMLEDHDDKDAVPVVTAAGVTKTMAPRRPEAIKRLELPDVEGSIDEFYLNIKASIEGKAEQRVKNDEVARVMRLMEAVFESAQKNQVIYFE